MSRGNAGVMQQVQESMRGIYGESMVSNWIRNEDTGLLWAGCHWKSDSRGLLRFRGGSDLQRFGRSFYIYDLLRLLPYAEVEVIDRETF